MCFCDDSSLHVCLYCVCVFVCLLFLCVCLLQCLFVQCIIVCLLVWVCLCLCVRSLNLFEFGVVGCFVWLLFVWLFVFVILGEFVKWKISMVIGA